MMNEINLYIQPAYNCTTNKIEYAEVLIRGYKGITGVSKIMKYIDNHGIQEQFDLDVLSASLSIMNRIDNLEYPIGVNLCPATIAKENIVFKIKRLIEEYNIKYSDLIIEINEDTDFTNDLVVKNLGELHKIGIKLALDDFGVEKANLYSLVKFNFDIIKVDKSFIGHEREESKNEILHIIKEITERFKMKSVVEGVENKQQLLNINKIGYTVIQGYIYTRPVPFLEFIESEKKRREQIWKA